MKKVKFFTVLLLVLICIFSLASCKQEEPDKWPETGLALQLPKPESGILKVTYDGNNTFLASVDQFDKTEYEKYSSACQQKGFTIDMVQNAYGYTVFNEEGYKLTLNYYSDSSMQIQLDPPIEIGDLKWPMGSAGKAVPEPSSKKGKMQWEHDDSFLVYVGETTFSDYNEYVDKCVGAGFVIDYSKGDKFYRAKNTDNFQIDISYEGFNVMRIVVDKNTDEKSSDISQTEESVTEITDQPENSDETSEKLESIYSEKSEQSENSNKQSSSPNDSPTSGADVPFKSKYESIIADNLGHYKSLSDEYTNKLADIKTKLGDTYDSYINNSDLLSEWYKNLKTSYTELFEETKTVTETVFKQIKQDYSVNDFDELEKEFEYLFDSYYSGVFSTLFDTIYTGMLDEIFDKYYSNVLSNIPTGIDYDAWSNTLTEFYNTWVKAQSDFYETWTKYMQNFYDSWSKAKTEMLNKYLDS